MGKINAEIVNDKAAGRCLGITNGIVEMQVTLDFGPRISHLSLVGMDNMLYRDEKKQQMKNVSDLYGGKYHVPFGGHRLYAFSDVPERCYYPDNGMVAYREQEGRFVFESPVEERTNLKKTLEIGMDSEKGALQILHRICNCGVWEVEVAPLCVTSLMGGGTAYIPMPKKGGATLPSANLLLWGGGLSCKGVAFSKNSIGINHSGFEGSDFKIGLNNENGFGAYLIGEQLLIKFFEPAPDGFYPYGNCTFTVECSKEGLEFSSYGELSLLLPGEEAVYTEELELYNLGGKAEGALDFERVLQDYVDF